MKKEIILIISFFSLIFLVVNVSAAGICEATSGHKCLYVATDGSNSNNGNFTNPFRTILYAISSMNGGDIIYLRSGTYYERDIYIDISKSGTANAWSILQSYPGEWAIIDGQRNCRSNVHAIIYNCGSAHQEGDCTTANYWKFERLEIKNGGRSSENGASEDAGAAGIDWVRGPVTIRYCYIHDNLANTPGGNPAGFTGCSQQNATLEYNYFRNNGVLSHSGDKNDKNICLAGSSHYSQTPYDENWYVKNNKIRYNLIQSNGGGGIGTKSYQLLTSVRDGSDLSNILMGDQIYNNIIVGARSPSIAYHQDFVQIHNNIIVSNSTYGSWNYGIDTREWTALYPNIDMLYATIYNNLVINNSGAAIFSDYGGGNKYPHWYCYNNIIDNFRGNDGDKAAIVFGQRTVSGADNNNISIDRNYFYNMISSRFIIWCNFLYSLSEWNNLHNTLNYQNDYNLNNLLYKFGGYYKINRANIINGTTTIANGGIGGNHPYLSGVKMPDYIGPCADDNCYWVDELNNLSYLDSNGIPVNLRDASAEDPWWIENSSINPPQPPVVEKMTMQKLLNSFGQFKSGGVLSDYITKIKSFILSE
jgi:hypothetical protein